jgi:two-component system heavy metal sensor histidine kinase CusS
MSALAELDHGAPQSVVLQIAQDRSDDKVFTKYFGELLLAVLAGGVACSAAVALLVAQRALRPLEEMATAMERVQASHLQQGLHRGRWPKELTSLAAAFDEMLARLKESFERLSRFSAISPMSCVPLFKTCVVKPRWHSPEPAPSLNIGK